MRLDREQHPRHRRRRRRVGADPPGERVLAAVGQLDDRRAAPGGAPHSVDLVPGALGRGAERGARPRRARPRRCLGE